MKQIICALLSAALMMHPVPAETDEPTDIIMENPLYETSEEEIVIPESMHSRTLVSETDGAPMSEVLASPQEVYEYARAEMVKRSSPIDISTIYAGADKDFVYTIMKEAMAHTGKPKEGDSLRYQWAKWDCSTSHIDYGMRYQIKISYYTDARQEEETDQAVKALLDELNVYDKSDYEKIKTVYDWIVSNVTYAEDDGSASNYSAYGALVRRSALCQGYAVLFYRLMLELNVDCRVISGEGREVLHAWNIVKLKNKYYNIDTTWAATSGSSKDYFLKGSSDFMGHEPLEEYVSSRFQKDYPIAKKNYQPNAEEDPESAATITLSQNELNMRTEEQTWLKVTVKPVSVEKDIVWTSSDPSVAKVDQKGTVTAVSRGTAVITATLSANGAKAECTVKVTDSTDHNGTIPMYRLYNPNTGEHFYTANAKERTALDAMGWNYEGIGWYAPASSSVPVYRLYNETGGEHHYTTNAAEQKALLGFGWNDEGIGWYSCDTEDVPLYRLYNPNAYANNHHYTTSVKEKNVLLRYGWRDEGIGWYGAK